MIFWSHFGASLEPTNIGEKTSSKARWPAGDMDQVVPGNALVVDKSMPFTQLSHFGDPADPKDLGYRL